jgi:hypothetical protein
MITIDAMVRHMDGIHGSAEIRESTARRRYLEGLLATDQADPYDAACALERIHASGWLGVPAEQVTARMVEELLRSPPQLLPWSDRTDIQWPSTWVIPLGRGARGGECRIRCLVPTHSPHRPGHRAAPTTAPAPLFGGAR